jgi:hypothetical protein
LTVKNFIITCDFRTEKQEKKDEIYVELDFDRMSSRGVQELVLIGWFIITTNSGPT